MLGTQEPFFVNRHIALVCFEHHGQPHAERRATLCQLFKHEDAIGGDDGHFQGQRSIRMDLQRANEMVISFAHE